MTPDTQLQTEPLQVCHDFVRAGERHGYTIDHATGNVYYWLVYTRNGELAWDMDISDDSAVPADVRQLTELHVENRLWDGSQVEKLRA